MELSSKQLSPNYNWLTQNSKIKKMSGPKTFNWGIPAYQSSTGMKTCPNAAACATGCYATMGAWSFGFIGNAKDVQDAYRHSTSLV